MRVDTASTAPWLAWRVKLPPVKIPPVEIPPVEIPSRVKLPVGRNDLSLP